jgi:selenocysteine lyase/cysteine desulfurase
LRAEFPVLRQLAYLNAGTDGPLASRAVDAAARELRREAERGRTSEHFERRTKCSDELRGAYAALLGCDAADLALTTCTTEGIAQVLGGLRLGADDEIVTSDEEHPGLLGALAAARERGVQVRVVPLAEVAEAVDPRRTRLIACSHVSWISGRLAPRELAQVDVPVLLDGAQGVGAIPVDVRALGCDAYAAAGQKWLCGPDGVGMLFVSPRLRAELEVTRRGYANLSDPGEGLRAKLHEDARRFDALSLSAETLVGALEGLRVLERGVERGSWPEVHERGRSLAARLAAELADRGVEVAPRAQTTLVSFGSSDPPGERARLADRGVILRNIPERPWLRASVGAWNDEDDLDRLLRALRP